MHKLVFGLVSLFPLMAMAESLFEQQVKQARPDRKTLLESEQKVKNHLNIKILDNLTVPPFHKRGTHSLSVQNSNAFCTECHLPLPHQAQLRSRAFLNMHVAYIACETCHLRPEGVPLEYRWLSYDKGNSRAEEARFYSGHPVKQKTAQEKDSQTSKSLPPRMTAVKIAPFYQNQPALVFKDSAFAQSIYKQWATTDNDNAAKAELRARLHTPLKKAGPECAACHTDHNGLLDFAALGATTEQKQALEHNTIADFFAHYKNKLNPQKPGEPVNRPNKEARIRITDLLK